MSPELHGQCGAFAAAHAVSNGFAILPPFLDSSVGAVVKALTVANVALDTIVKWVPEIATMIVNTSLGLEDITKQILDKIQAAGG